MEREFFAASWSSIFYSLYIRDKRNTNGKLCSSWLAVMMLARRTLPADRDRIFSLLYLVDDVIWRIKTIVDANNKE